MSAFQFPDPASQQSVTNPSTGSTYEWKADPGKWVLVSSAGEMPDIPEQVTYQIQTDKILRSTDPAIELVDSAGFYSNVKFSGTGGVGVTSDFNGIIIDGASIDTSEPSLPYSLELGSKDSTTGEEISSFQLLETITLRDAQSNNLGQISFESGGGLGIAIDNSYDYPVISFQASTIDNRSKSNEDRIDILELRHKVVETSFTVVNRTGEPTIRDGEMSIDAKKTNDINFISIGPTSLEGVAFPVGVVGDSILMTKKSNGLRHHFIITGGANGLYGVETDDNTNSTIDLVDYILEIIPVAISVSTSDTNESELIGSLITGLKYAVTTATDFQDLREKMLLTLSQVEIAATAES